MKRALQIITLLVSVLAAGCADNDPPPDSPPKAEPASAPPMEDSRFIQKACDATGLLWPFWAGGTTAACTPVTAPPSGGAPPDAAPMGLFGPDGSAQVSIDSPNLCAVIWRADEDRFYAPQPGKVSLSLSQDYLPIPQARWGAGQGIEVETELTGVATGLAPDHEGDALFFVYRIQVFNRSREEFPARICVCLRPHRLDGSIRSLGTIGLEKETICTVDGRGMIQLPAVPAIHGAIAAANRDEPEAYLFGFDVEIGTAEGEFAAATPVVDLNVLLATSPPGEWPEEKKTRIGYARSHIDWASSECLNEVRFHTPNKQLEDTWRAALARLVMAARSVRSTGRGLGRTLFSATSFQTVETTAAAAALNRAGRFTEARILLDCFDDLIQDDGQIPFELLESGEPSGPAAPAWNNRTLYALAEHYRFTHDKEWLAGKKDLILGAAGRLEEIAARTTEEGLVRPADSSAPIRFADSFDVVNGLESAAFGAAEIGLDDDARRFSRCAGSLRTILRQAIPAAMEEAKINFIPAGPSTGLVRADDPDTVTGRITADDAIRLGNCAWPGSIFTARDRWAKRSIELNWIMFFEDAGGGMRSGDIFLPAGMELASTMLALRKEEYPARVLEWYAAHTTKHGIHTWAEALAGSESAAHRDPSLRADAAYVTLMRNLFVMERGDYLFLAPGLTLRWFEIAKELGVENAPTAYGRVSFSMTTEKLKSTIDFLDTSALPPRGYMMNQVYPSQKFPITVDGKPYSPAIQDYLLIFPPGTKRIGIEW